MNMEEAKGRELQLIENLINVCGGYLHRSDESMDWHACVLVPHLSKALFKVNSSLGEIDDPNLLEGLFLLLLFFYFHSVEFVAILSTFIIILVICFKNTLDLNDVFFSNYINVVLKYFPSMNYVMIWFMFNMNTLAASTGSIEILSRYLNE